MMSFSFSFMAAFPCSFIVDALWKRLQHDYAGFKAYERAVQQYKLLRAEWLKTQRSWWDELHPQRFEQEVALFFKSQGYRVEWTGRSGDGGVDIKVTNQEGKKIVVQCKAHQKPVPPGAVRELFGTLLHEKADEGWLMSRSGFTVGAAKFATGKPIRLLDLNHVILGRGI
jgi:restriction system protein